MPNYPVKSRGQDKRRPPRFERLHDLAAFLLGYEPYHVGADLFFFQDALQPATERWLRDLPVHVRRFLDPYSVGRLGETINEVILQFEEHPNVRPPPQPADPSDPLATESVTSDASPLITDRTVFSFNAFLYGGDQPGHALIRLAQSASELFPDPMQQWFRFGQSVGQCLLRVAAEPYRPDEDREWEIASGKEIQPHTSGTDGDPKERCEATKIDLKREIQQASSGTDWHPDDVPDLCEAAVPDGYRDPYDRWVYDSIERFVLEVRHFLEDDAPIVLSLTRSGLWFLGTPVDLTSSECAFLGAAADCTEDTITREYLRQKGLVVEPHKADQWLQQIVGKITAALGSAKSAYYKGTDEATRKWLREEFFVSAAGTGWRKGPLLARMAVARGIDPESLDTETD